MTMSNLRTIGKVTGAAATTAPVVRRLATDDEFRDDVTDFIRSASNLMTHLRSDRRLRSDLDKMVASVQSGADHLREDVRPTHHYLRNFVIGSGLIILGIGAAIAFGYPRTRRQVTSAFDQTAKRANSTVQDIRGRMSGQGDAQAA